MTSAGSGTLLFRPRAADYYRSVDEWYDGAQDSPAPSGEKTQSAGPVNVAHVELCREAMTNLINRYDIRGKRVLSIGSGDGHEEYWFWKNHCALTFVDNDPRYMEHVRNLDAAKENEDALDFYLADASDFLAQTGSEMFDLCYVSSFHPDEKRREGIQETYKLVRSDSDRANYITWPRQERPYSNVLMEAVKPVKQEGLIIFQHYCGGVDLTYNAHYLPLVQTQLQSRGVELLEVYYFTKSPGIQLLVGLKGPDTLALNYLEKIQCNHEIETFHGRYPYAEYKRDVSKAFDLFRATRKC